MAGATHLLVLVGGVPPLLHGEPTSGDSRLGRIPSHDLVESKTELVKKPYEQTARDDDTGRRQRQGQ